MAWNTALWANGIVIVLAIVAATIIKGVKGSSDQPLTEYLLAGTTLKKGPIISLLVSSSFGLNALLYQIWLGYSVGILGLVAQFAWVASFWLLSKHVKSIRSQRSLHGLLGSRFGSTTRIIAGICSIVGILLLISWETEIGRAALSGLLNTSAETKEFSAETASEWLIFGIVLGCVIYTVLGGLSGNARADILLNLTKIASVIAVMVLLFHRENAINSAQFIDALWPSMEKFEKNLGVGGLITNIVFSILWQYVDTSTWQSIIAGSKSKLEDSISSLRLTALAVFIAPGIIGTLLGIALTGASNITSDNVLSQSVLLSGGDSNVILFFAFAIIVACMLSLLDGYILAVAYTIIIDITHSKRTIQELDNNYVHAEKLLVITRFFVVCVVLIAVWGIPQLFKSANLNLFDFVYVVIIAQLALIGPVLSAIFKRNPAIFPMWTVIVIALIVGFGVAYIGSVNDIKWAIDWAGTITAVISGSIAWLLSSRKHTNSGDRNG